jgi:hypothetical protein
MKMGTGTDSTTARLGFALTHEFCGGMAIQVRVPTLLLPRANLAGLQQEALGSKGTWLPNHRSACRSASGPLPPDEVNTAKCWSTASHPQRLRKHLDELRCLLLANCVEKFWEQHSVQSWMNKMLQLGKKMSRNWTA